MSISYQNHSFNLITTDFHAFHKPYTLNRVDPYIKPSITTKQRKTARLAAGLAQAKRLRSGEGSALAQATGSHLGETASKGLGVFAQNTTRSPERVFEKNSWARYCYSRLGEMSSPGRKQQVPPTVQHLQSRNSTLPYQSFNTITYTFHIILYT